MKVLILTQTEVEDLLPMDECIPVMREALTALARGRAYQPLRMVVRPPESSDLMILMPSVMSGAQAAYGLKALCIFPQNPAVGKDAHQGAVMLFSGESGELLALMNASAITAIRTAAVSGVATDLLARQGEVELAIIGAGVQARSHLQAVSCSRPIKRARVASRHFTHAHSFAQEMSRHYSFPIVAVETVEAAVKDADVIVTATTAPAPILRREWVAPGAHINAVGASLPTMREIDTATVAAAGFFVDYRESTLKESGDYLLALREGAIGPDHIRAEIGEVLIGAKLGRTSDDEITLFKSLGLAVEDLAAAEYIYRKAQTKNIGTRVEF